MFWLTLDTNLSFENKTDREYQNLSFKTMICDFFEGSNCIKSCPKRVDIGPNIAKTVIWSFKMYHDIFYNLYQFQVGIFIFISKGVSWLHFILIFHIELCIIHTKIVDTQVVWSVTSQYVRAKLRLASWPLWRHWRNLYEGD